ALRSAHATPRDTAPRATPGSPHAATHHARLRGSHPATGTPSFPALATRAGPSRLPAGSTARRGRISPWFVPERRSAASLALPNVGDEGRETVLGDGLSRPPHQREVVVEVVEGGQPEGQQLVGGEEVAEVGPGVGPAGVAVAA